MASSVSHAFFAWAGAGGVLGRLPRRLGWLIVFCATVPDIDVLWAMLDGRSVWAHRGVTHSLAMAVVLPMLLLATFYRRVGVRTRRWWGIWLVLFGAVASHLLLDMMVQTETGVALLAPMSSARFMLPWQPLPGLEGPGNLTDRALTLVLVEFLVVWLPMIALLAARKLATTLLRRRTATAPNRD